MQRRPLLLALGSAGLVWPLAGHAHHGWSSFDQTRPIWLSGRAVKVHWRNPHVELVLERPVDAEALPADLAQRVLPAQTASVDGPALLAATRLPTRRDRPWTVELAPLTRLNAWGVPEVTVGTTLSLLGFTFTGEKGDAVLRAEFLWLGDKVYGMRSSPA